ncbi:MAG: hypothetical protein J7497_03750, partial [Chitinophagaceae bacterium]|nr:hypothetical protein [Chitinophagaceae bacterium]
MIATIMRILYFSRDYGSYTTTFIRNQVEYFAAKYECLYLCQNHFGERPRFVKVVPYRSRFIRRLLWRLGSAADFYDKEYSSAISAILEEFKPDIIHCHFVA